MKLREICKEHRKTYIVHWNPGKNVTIVFTDIIGYASDVDILTVSVASRAAFIKDAANELGCEHTTDHNSKYVSLLCFKPKHSIDGRIVELMTHTDAILDVRFKENELVVLWLEVCEKGSIRTLKRQRPNLFVASRRTAGKSRFRPANM